MVLCHFSQVGAMVAYNGDDTFHQLITLNQRSIRMNISHVPSVIFHTRVRNSDLAGENPYEWKDLNSEAIFRGRKIVLVALPGAFTPACSNTHLPEFEAAYEQFMDLGVDEVVCVSVNDAFVMFQWAKALGVSRIRMLPDGNGHFSEKMGMLVRRDAQGMGPRSWRYSAYIEDGEIMKMFAEPNLQDNPKGVPVSVSNAQTMLDFLTQQ